MNGYKPAVRKCRHFAASVREALREFRQKHYAREWLLLFFWLYLCWCEGIVRINSAQFFWTIGLLTTALFSAVAAMLLYVLCSVFSQRVNRVLELIACYGLLIFYASQLIYNYKFHFFYSAYSMGNGGQVLEFWRVILHALWVKAVPLLLMLLPAVLLSIYGRVFARSRIGSRLRRAYFAAGALALHMAIVLLLPAFGHAPMSPYDLYHETNDLSKGALQLGLLPAFRLDVHRLIFGFDGGELVTPEEPSSLSSEPTQLPSDEPMPSETEPVPAPTVLPEYDAAEYNVLELDFAALAEGEENETVRSLHEYFAMQTPTKKNEKTGVHDSGDTSDAQSTTGSPNPYLGGGVNHGNTV